MVFAFKQIIYLCFCITLDENYFSLINNVEF